MLPSIPPRPPSPPRQIEGAQPLAIEWHKAPERREGPPSSLGKRSAEEVEQPGEGLSQSSDGPRFGWKRRYTRLSDWPTEWLEQYTAWKALPDMEERQKLWSSWDPALRDQVWSTTSTPMRCEIRSWMAEESGAFSQGCTPRRPKAKAPLRRKGEQPSSPATQSSFHPVVNEEDSHDWHEGARIGEATNPGPAPGCTQSTTTTTTSPKTNPARATQNATSPRGHERRKPGKDDGARQASSSGWPHRNQHHSAQKE